MVSCGNATLIVSNMDTSVRFYTEALGMKLLQRFEDDWAVVEAGGFSIGLHPPTPEYPPAGTRGGVALGLDIDLPIDDAVKRLAEFGVAPKGEITRRDHGNFVSIADPDGYQIYLWEKPAVQA